MKKLAIAAIGLFALGLAGCASVESAITAVTSTSTTPAEVNTVAAAANLFTAADTAADAFVKTSKCSKACRDEIAKLSADVRADLDDALAAEQAGDSAKVKIALDAFNQAFPTFTSYLQSNGVSL